MLDRTASLVPVLVCSLLVAPALGQRRGARKADPAPPAPAAPAPPALPLTAAMLKPLKARSIGPAVMSGRVSEIALDPSDPAVFYLGLATGGVWKTSNYGGTFEPVMDSEPVSSIGAVAVAPSDPRVVWVGTGEANDRNSSGWGNGVYRSTDAGATWTRAGLADGHTVARIAVKPDDPNTAWVAVPGDLWQPGPERGLFKTTDGGKTWRKVLAGPDAHASRVGCGDVAIDPSNPSVLYAALYARRRTPWSFVAGPAATDGKDLGGIFKSVDGGETWKKLAGGLPASTGRIGLDVFRKDPKVVYAVVQSDKAGTSDIGDVRSRRGGIFRSGDGGETWRRTSQLNPRPFYFSQVRVDPANDRRVYVLGFALHVSDDGGETFREDLFEKVHPDCHALAVDWRNPKRLLLGTDGGAYQSFEGGKGWLHLNRFPAGQFYRITVDMSAPYRIAGGLQDNLNWVGPSATRTKDGIVNSDWITTGGGDGFYNVFDPEDPNVVYGESQSGYVHRFHLGSGATKDLRPEPAEGSLGFRFHWCAPFIPSRHAKGVMYLAGNRVFRLSARGEEWRAISPDLSARDPEKIATAGSGAETYGVVYTLAESPAQAGLLWAGTDDGKLWVTHDEGASWTDLSANVPEPARGHWINRVEPSAFDAKVAYMAVDAHRTGTRDPLLYRTEDGGKTWASAAGDLPAGSPVKVVRESSRNRDLLFAGTEFGLYVSADRGARWHKFGGLPAVPVDDLAIHPRERDLVVATHGRSLYVVDDVSPLEALDAAAAKADAHLFPVRPAHGFEPLPGFSDWMGKGEYRGENPPLGAIITFHIREFTGDEVKISIANAAEQTVANIKAAGTPGFNRVVWDLKPTKDVLTEYGGEGKRFVRPGEYTVTLAYGKTKLKQKVTVSIAEGLETR